MIGAHVPYVRAYVRTRPPAPAHASFVSHVVVVLVLLTFGQGIGEHFRRDELIHEVVLEHTSDLPVRCREDIPVKVLVCRKTNK